MKLKKRIKWYCQNSHLELFDPKLDKIYSIEYEGIDNIWKVIIDEDPASYKSLSETENRIFCKLYRYLKENDYVEFDIT